MKEFPKLGRQILEFTLVLYNSHCHFIRSMGLGSNTAKFNLVVECDFDRPSASCFAGWGQEGVCSLFQCPGGQAVRALSSLLPPTVIRMNMLT